MGDDPSDAGEFCSTPRNFIPQDPSEVFVSLPTGVVSPTESEESEADVIERTIRLSANCASDIGASNDDPIDCQQLTHQIEPTQIITGSIMHTSESPSQMNIPPIMFLNQAGYVARQPNPAPEPQASSSYFGSPNTETFLPTFQGPSGPMYQPVQPSAPPLQDTQPPHSIPLMNVAQFNAPVLGSPKPSGHLGHRPSVTSPPPMPELRETQPTEQLQAQHQAAVDGTGVQSSLSDPQSPSHPNVAPTPPSVAPTPPNAASPQENISISPITSPHRTILLKPSVHWYYSNPDGSYTPFSYHDSNKIEGLYTARAHG